jgi:hypothetical protein
MSGMGGGFSQSLRQIRELLFPMLIACASSVSYITHK